MNFNLLPSNTNWLEPELPGMDLTADNLNAFLKDAMFVEYFNSFLLLPTFSCHIFYDYQLGVFESVQDDQRCWSPEDHGLLSSCSASTVYLPHSRLKHFSNPTLCEEWIKTHRLPLFVKSELYSEYKLLKILTNSAASFFKTCIQQARDKNKANRCGSGSRPRSTRRKLSAQGRPFSGIRGGNASARRLSLPATPTEQQLDPPTRIRGQINLLKSKSGLGIFRKFLNGKLGETNMMVWIEMECLKNAESKDEFMSGLKELCWRYPQMHDVVLNIKTYNERLLQIEETQSMYLNSLKEYWYPRFLVSFMKEPSTSLPLVNLSNATDAQANLSLKTHTPTFRKLPKPKSSHHPIPFASTTTSHHIKASSTPHLISNTCDHFERVKSSRGTCTSKTRLLWSRDSGKYQYDSVLDQPMERSSRLATYNMYPLVPCGRTSALSIDPLKSCPVTRPVTPLHPPPPTQILSVTGTPVPIDHYKQKRAEYKSLLNCLSLEKTKAGGYFQKHLELSPDKVNTNCLYFWREVQEYKTLFLKCSFSISAVEMKAKVMYGRYIFEGNPNWISCTSDVAMAVFERLWPAFEDLFDEAEDHALSVLLVQWRELCQLEYQSFENLQHFETLDSYSRVSCMELEKLSEEYEGSSYSYSSFEGSSVSSLMEAYSSNAQRPRTPTNDDPELNSEKKSAIQIAANIDIGEEHKEGIKVQKEMPANKEIAFGNLLKNSRELEYFKMFLNDNNGAIHLMCWMEIEGFRAIPAADKVMRNMKAKQIRKKYFNKQYFFGPLSPVTKDIQRQVVNVGGSQKLPSRPKSAVFREAQKYVRAKLEKLVLVFIRSLEYLERNEPTQLQKNEGEDETANDDPNVLCVESHDTILLRRALTRSDERTLFQNFINAQAAEGQCPSRQVDFWLEVQRYKDMFHSHMNTKLLMDKMNAILVCYFKSQVPPRVQIDIPFKVAEETVKKDFGPYIFREAQAIIFRNLQGLWNEYQNFIQDSDKGGSIEAAIKGMELKIATARIEMREEKERLKMEEERNKQSMPRFETMEEKRLRLKREEEEKEFGEVAVTFRLSRLNPKFTYFLSDTDRPPRTTHNSTTSENSASSNKKRKTVHYDLPLDTRMSPQHTLQKQKYPLSIPVT